MNESLSGVLAGCCFGSLRSLWGERDGPACGRAKMLRASKRTEIKFLV